MSEEKEKIVYDVVVNIKVSSLVPEVARVENELNAAMAEAKVNEHLQVVSELIVSQLTVSKELDAEEIRRIQDLMKNEYEKVTALTGKVAFVELRRKSTGQSKL